MATRIRTSEAEPVPVAEPSAVARLTALVDALPDRGEDFFYVNGNGNTVTTPAAMRFWEVVGLTAFEEAMRVMPDRAKYLAWLCDPYGSPWGCDAPRLPVPSSHPYLFPSKGPHR